MFGLAAEQWTAIGVIASVIGAIFAAMGLPLAVLAWRNHLIDELTKNSTKRDRIGRALGVSRILDVYRAALEGGLDRLDRWMGGYGDLARGYGWCLTIALAYAAGFVFVPWLLFGQGTSLGEFELLAPAVESLDWWLRFTSTLLLFLVTLGGALLLKRLDSWRQRRRAKLFLESSERIIERKILNVALVTSAFAQLFGLKLRKKYFLYIIFIIFVASFILSTGIMIIGAGAIIAGISITSPLVESGNIYVVMLVLFSMGPIFILDRSNSDLGFRTIIFAGLTFVAVLSAWLLSIFGLVAPGPGLAMGLFLIVLPLINALLDWPSWLVSRALGRDLLRKLDGGRWRQLWALVWHAVVDLFFAALFLVGLAAFLPRGVSLLLDLARFIVGEVSADVAPYLCTAAQDPLGRGLWASAMLFSTLVPTALHLMFLIASPLAFWARPHGPVWQERAAYLRGERQAPPEADLPESPSLRDVALAGDGLLRETATKVAWWRIRQTLLLYPTALLIATGFLFLLWDLIQAFTGSLPAWLLLIASGDRAFVDSCLPGAL